MYKNNATTDFVGRLSQFALSSQAVKHPYLTAVSSGELPDAESAFKDFALQYGYYSRHFTRYLTAVIDNLKSEQHKEILRENLAEECGNVHEVQLPSAVLESIADQPHSALYRRFQDAIGVNDAYRADNPPSPTAQLWNQQFLQLCETNEWVGIGAIGIGTELIVSDIYNQILDGLKNHTKLTLLQRVFFDLHSECDHEHAAQILAITRELATTEAAREHIEFGVKMAIHMRCLFWEKMHARALSYSAQTIKHVRSASIV